MVDVSVGVASACIAAVITILQFLLPNALALILSGQVAESHSAVTWSVVSRFLLTSDWPVFLRSDHAASTSVPRKISWLTFTKPCGLLLIAIAAIITPLGLYDHITPSRNQQIVNFVYVADQSAIGAGTPPRSSRGYSFSRKCTDHATSRLCPGDSYLGNVTTTETVALTNDTTIENDYILPESISPTLIDQYQSGLVGSSPSLSSFFDIQFRQWTIFSDKTVYNNGTLLRRADKYLSTTFMDDKYELFEGVIVNAKSGGIGFRNHSVPSTFSQYGTEWEEDLLWMQPETSCVNTNLTSIFTGALTSFSQQDSGAAIVDQGGFTNIEKIRPFPNDTNPFTEGQNNPMLYERSYWMAWYLNVFAMQYLDVTDPGTNRTRISSAIGQKFVVNSSMNTVGSTKDYMNLGLGSAFTSLVVNAPSSYSWNSTTNSYNYNYNPRIPNPHNITGDYVSDAALFFTGYGPGDQINISTPAVQMGYVLGVPQVSDRADADNASSVATYERPLYICSSSTRASIKTVRFRYNSTAVRDLRGLEIMQINDRVYGKEEDKPLWGFETPWVNSNTTWNISQINPLWGIVDETLSTNRNVSTLRSDHFYIPASSESTSNIGYSSYTNYDDFLAGTMGPPDNWGQLYGSSPPYSGDNVQVKFFESLTQNTTGVEKLLNLLWTDYAGNYMVGTRGLHTPGYKPMNVGTADKKRDISSILSLSTDVSDLADGTYPVFVLERQIRYRWVWGIPAFICVVIVGLAVLIALIGMIFGNATVSHLRNLMYNISTGRVFASFTYPELRHDKAADTKQWIQSVGHKPIHPFGKSSAVQQREWVELRQSKNYVQIGQTEDTEPMTKGRISRVWVNGMS